MFSLSLSLSAGASLMGAAEKKDFGPLGWPLVWHAQFGLDLQICMTIPLLAESHKTRVAATFGPGP